MNPKSDIFDRDEFDELVMGNETLGRRIIRTFVDDMPRQLARLAEAVNAGDPAQVRLAAHSMKGAAASVSGREMREVCGKLEQQAMNHDLTAAPAAMRSLSTSFERARPLMEDYLRE
jgi:HPt (histidine-containing phosphotransfer) domain-containing protein